MSEKEKISNVFKTHKDYLFNKYHLKTIGLFGSVCREDFTDNSDVDILVEFDKSIGVEFIDLADELEQLLNRKVDLVSKNGVKLKYLTEIEKDLIYV
ncbi:MAG: nucleotidyltransferase family protein [Ignavibacteriae bacterium]|nr:nucleotidyltransferase family protein [Ignavibacteriota bacterium]